MDDVSIIRCCVQPQPQLPGSSQEMPKLETLGDGDSSEAPMEKAVIRCIQRDDGTRCSAKLSTSV
jgi:hypothetical protein